MYSFHAIAILCKKSYVADALSCIPIIYTEHATSSINKMVLALETEINEVEIGTYIAELTNYKELVKRMVHLFCHTFSWLL